ncbi:MAG: AMP-binding protein [Phenylobacterium sp.]|uniref:AMP-binding protein n=1 Tax=Phenylobacterium sp. TaxID=1871053 RepID=UPI003BB49E84
MDLHYASILEAHAAIIGDRPAIRQGGHSVSWAQFDDRAGRFASALRAAGLTRGSRVGQLLFNSPEHLETFHGALKLRAIPFNINYRYTAQEILHILRDAEAEALVLHSSLSATVAEVLAAAPSLKLVIVVEDGGVKPSGALAYEEVMAAYPPLPPMARDADDPVMVYTGGTTGMPKGVMAPMAPHLHQVLQGMPAFAGLPPIDDAAELPSIAARLHAEARPYVGLPLAPLVHGAALNIMALPTLIMGGTLVLASGRHFDPREAWSLVAQERVNSMLIVGDAFGRPLANELAQNPLHDITSLRLISSAGATLSSEVKADLLTYMSDDAAILEFIASTEAPMGSSIATRARPVQTGRFTPSPGVLVLDEDDRPIESGRGVAGRIAVPTSTYGYLNDAPKSSATFPVIGGVRYAIPGDYAVRYADGDIQLLGRGSSCINTGGLKVFPEEVENVLKAHPAVSDAVVFGIPDDRFGEIVAAILSLVDKEATPQQVLTDVRRHLAGFKIPRTVEVVAEVPRNNVGKPDYVAVRKMLQAGAPTST